MDDHRFDALVRVLGSDAPRRRLLAGILASVPLALGRNAAAKPKKCKKGKKKCGNRCIPKSNCCTAAQCDANETCTNGTCVCAPDCDGKVCGPNGCGGFCGSRFCAPRHDCIGGQCICVPNCFDKGCGSDGCGNPCKTCDTGETCNTQGQCCNNASGECDCNRGYVCGGSVPICDAQSNCGCTSVLEGGVVCASGFCEIDDDDPSSLCPSTEYCVNKYGPGFVCQAPGTGCCGQRCIYPCGFVPEESGLERSGKAGEDQVAIGRNVRKSGSGKDQ